MNDPMNWTIHDYMVISSLYNIQGWNTVFWTLYRKVECIQLQFIMCETWPLNLSCNTSQVTKNTCLYWKAKHILLVHLYMWMNQNDYLKWRPGPNFNPTSLEQLSEQVSRANTWYQIVDLCWLWWNCQHLGMLDICDWL